MTVAPAQSRIVLVAGARTPIGSFGGALSSVDAHELGEDRKSIV